MPENTNEIFNNIIVILAVLCTCAIFCKIIYTVIRDRFAPVKQVKAQVADKFVADGFSKIYGSMARKPQYFVVFSIENKKRSFRVSEFSYKGYKVGERGTLKYKGSKLVDFH